MSRISQFLFAYIVASLLTLSMNTHAKDAPKVAVTIPPLHSLVQMVLGETGTAELLIKGNKSPHGYQLKPSQIRSLRSSQLIFWVGPGLEGFMLRAFRDIDLQEKSVELIELDTLITHPVRVAGVWEEERKDQHEGEGHKEEGHDEDGIDHHYWLDPINAQKTIQHVAKKLSEIDPDNAPIYAANAKAAVKELALLHSNIAQQLTPHLQKPYILFHDAFQYFEARYKLNAQGSLLLRPNDSASAKQLGNIRQKITTDNAKCIFREPQFSVKLTRTAAEGTKAKQQTLDPLGMNIAPGSNLYFELMETITTNLVSCLK
jgi:zinc transport system substrate-binding protein